jgi:hypothetical protein
MTVHSHLIPTSLINRLKIVVQLKSNTGSHTQKHSTYHFDIIPRYIDYDEHRGVIHFVQFLLLHTAMVLGLSEGFKSELIAKIAYIVF